MTDLVDLVSIDFETHLIEPGRLAPPVVCGGRASSAGAELLLADAALDAMRDALLGGATVVGANVAFDLGCYAASRPGGVAHVFRALDEGRVHDVLIAQALDAIAGGHLGVDPRTGGPLKHPSTGRQTKRYSLEVVVDLVLGRADAKRNDRWRTSYALLDGVPLEEWPPEARQYPVDDAANALEVAVKQLAGHRNLGDMAAQADAAFCLHLGAMWGLRADPERVAALRATVEPLHAEFERRFRARGFLRDDGREDKAAVRRAVAIAYGASGPCPNPRCVGGRALSDKSGNPVLCPDCGGAGIDVSPAPRTEKGGVSCDRDALVESGDADLVAYGENEPEKVRDTYLPWLERAVAAPLSLRPNVVVASGRVSYDDLIQLLPRQGGVRPCFRARDGYLYAAADYSGIELCTLAQVCLHVLGHSQMAETMRADGDPGALHTAFAASMLGISAEEMKSRLKDDATKAEAKRVRHAAKAANFGFPGGMGSAKFVLSKRGRGEGSTTAADGTAYPGIRFCVLLRGVERCGEVRVTEWLGRPIPPTCRACLEVVDTSLRPAWFRQWPEVREYFAWVQRRIDTGGEFPCFGRRGSVARVRGGLDFCDGANNGFQSLAANGAKAALRAVARECYMGGGALLDSRPIFFLHDEIFAEVPDGIASEAAERLAAVMVREMSEFVPDLPVRVEVALMRHWYKGAEAIRDESGRLVPWEPKI